MLLSQTTTKIEKEKRRKKKKERRKAERMGREGGRSRVETA